MRSISQLFESGEQSRQKGHFQNLLMLARIDGIVSKPEMRFLKKIASKLSLTDEQVDEILKNPSDYPSLPPATREERYERFIQLMQLLVVDGQTDQNEVAFVRKMGLELGFTPQSIDAKFPIIMEHLRKGMTREEVLFRVLS